MKTIFITGIAGFLGSHLADRLLDLGYKVKGNDNLIGGYKHNVPLSAEFYEIDCTDRLAMLDAMLGCDIVVHTAATAYEGLSVFSPDFIFKNTAQSTMSTISAAITAGVKRIVYCSSMARYGDQAVPFTEDMAPAPVDPYGIAKVAGENVLKNLCKVHGVEWNIAVPHNIIGPRQKYDDPYRNVVSIMINRCLQDRAPVIYGDGNQKRCFSYIDDCIFGLERLTLDPDIRSVTVNIGPDEEFVTINDLAALVIKLTGKNLSPIHLADRPLEVKYATCSADLARRLFGYKTQTSLRQSIEKTIEYINTHGTKDFSYSLPLEIVNDLTPITWSKQYFNEHK